MSSYRRYLNNTTAATQNRNKHMTRLLSIYQSKKSKELEFPPTNGQRKK